MPLVTGSLERVIPSGSSRVRGISKANAEPDIIKKSKNNPDNKGLSFITGVVFPIDMPLVIFLVSIGINMPYVNLKDQSSEK
jgi:hypothetical protein